MPRPQFLARSPVERTVRLLLAAVALVAAYLGMTFSLAQVQARSNPELAHKLARYDGRVSALLAASFADPDATPADRRRADALALRALRRDATTVSAISTLGLDAQTLGEVGRARLLFDYSQKLSRRDLQTQLWLIEDAVGRGDVSAALRHYDVALRTSPNIGEVLFPVLTAASADPAIRTALIRTLAGKPAWSDNFVNYAAAKSTDPYPVAQLLLGLQRAGVALPQSARAAVIQSLIDRKRPDAAWSYYAAIHSGLDPHRSRDPHFMADLQPPSAFDWVSANDVGMSSSVQRGEGGGVFEFSAPASVGGSLIQQMQVLPPGDYRIEGHSAGIQQEESARPYWLLRCDDGRELGRVTLPNSDQAGGRFTGRFSVPAGCPSQMLVLIARASSEVAGLSGQIDRVQLSPSR